MLERLGLAPHPAPKRPRKPEPDEPVPVTDEAEAGAEELGTYAELTWSDEDLARKAAAEDAVQAAEDELSAAQEAHAALVSHLDGHDARQRERDSQRAAVEAERASAAAAESVEAVMAAEAKLSAIATVDTSAAEKRGELSRALAAASERVAEAERALTAAQAAEAALFEEIGRLIPHGICDVITAHRAARLAETSRRAYPVCTPADELAEMLAALPDVVAREAHTDWTAIADEYEAITAPAPEPEPWTRQEALEYQRRATIRLREIQIEEYAEREAIAAYGRTQQFISAGIDAKPL